jgi:uncharacterized protein
VNDLPSAVYLDASAIVKLVLKEAESEVLRRALSNVAGRFSSRIAVVEVHRVTMRQTEVDASEAVEAVLAGIEMIELDDPIARAAAEMAPPTLRSLDAIHLASALALGDELGAFVTYDGRLADAARSAGLPVIAPS